MTTRRDLFALGLVALSTLMPRALLAQPKYPDRPVRLVIPFPPGGAAAARARPDGYTILLGGSSTHVTEAILKSRPLYDPLKDLEPISNLVVSPFALAIHPAVPARTLREFIDYAKANPGKLS